MKRVDLGIRWNQWADELNEVELLWMDDKRTRLIF